VLEEMRFPYPWRAQNEQRLMLFTHMPLGVLFPNLGPLEAFRGQCPLSPGLPGQALESILLCGLPMAKDSVCAVGHRHFEKLVQPQGLALEAIPKGTQVCVREPCEDVGPAAFEGNP
jgi:hypothetical protein